MMKRLTRSGVLIDEEGSTRVAHSDPDEARPLRPLRPLQAAARPRQVAFVLRAGQKVLTLQGAMPKRTD